MTKVSIFGQETEKKKSGVIELCYWLNPNGKLDKSTVKASSFDNVERISRESIYDKYDVIEVWNDSWNFKNIFLGHWNDGFVE